MADTDKYYKISGKYTVFNKITLYQDEVGAYWADPLWAKDLLLLLNYIEDLSLCCPVKKGLPPEGFINISHEARQSAGIKIIPLRVDNGWGSVFLNIIPNFWTVARTARKSDIVHSGGSGWAFPNSFFLVPLRKVMAFKWIINIEAMFWKIADSEKATLRRRVGQALHEYFLSRAVKAADVRLFTHPGFRDYFLSSEEEHMINPASWLDAEAIDCKEAVLARRSEREPEAPLRVVFASRLVAEKGTPELLQALQTLSAKNAAIDVTIIGQGEERRKFEELAEKVAAPVRITLVDWLPYGEAFFNYIKDFDAVLVLSRSEEQPRIIFDAFSKGVAVILSATEGNLSVTSEQSSLSYPPGDAVGLADVLMLAAQDISDLHTKGLAGLDVAHASTHVKMHQTRSAYLEKLLS